MKEWLFRSIKEDGKLDTRVKLYIEAETYEEACDYVDNIKHVTPSNVRFRKKMKDKLSKNNNNK